MTDFRTAASGGAKETQPTEQPSARGGCGLPVSDCHLHFRAAACGGRTSFGEVRASAAGGCGPPAYGRRFTREHPLPAPPHFLLYYF